MTCKDCIHNDLCEALEMNGLTKVHPKQCGFYTDRSRYVELPCKVGDKLYYIPFVKTIEECIVHAVEYEEKATIVKCHLWRKEFEGLLHKNLVYFNIDDFGKMVFLTKEEAERALSERSSR